MLKNLSVTKTPSAVTSTSSPLICATGLRKAFGGLVVLSDVDLELTAGEVVLLRGENGSGKTTLLNILTGMLEPDEGKLAFLTNARPRLFRFPRSLWQTANPFDQFNPETLVREGISRTWQDVRLFGTQSLHDNIAVALVDPLGETPSDALTAPWRVRKSEIEIRRKSDELLKSLGMQGRADSKAAEISLGESKRVSIARARLAGAKVVLLDEPLSGLDKSGVASVLELLHHIVNEHAATLVIIEHYFNQHHLRDLITTEWALSGGKLQKTRARAGTGTPRTLQSNIANITSAIRSKIGAETLVSTQTLPRGGHLTIIRPSDALKETKPALEVSNLSVRRGKRTVVGLDHDGHADGVSFSLCEDDIAILEAPNGWGKTTLFESIAGFAETATGTVRVRGSEIGDAPAWKRARAGVQLLASQAKLFPNLTSNEFLSLAGASGVSLVGKEQSRISQLSGGQRQLLAVLALRSACAVTLCDEPFLALDEASTNSALEKLLTLNSGCTLIAIPATN